MRSAEGLRQRLSPASAPPRRRRGTRMAGCWQERLPRWHDPRAATVLQTSAIPWCICWSGSLMTR